MADTSINPCSTCAGWLTHPADTSVVRSGCRDCERRSDIAAAFGRGLIPANTVLPGVGTVVGHTLTAYVLAGEPNTVVSFERVHGKPASVMPLVTFG